MAIPQAQAFVTAQGKGPNIAKVTAALVEYWRVQGDPNSNVQENVLAYQQLIAAGKAWIKMKEDKSDFKKNLIGQHTNYINTKFTGRRQAIAGIVKDATEELMALLRQNNLLTSNLKGEMYFDIHKYQQKALTRAQRHDTKQLASGYEQERLSWLMSGKTRAVSGSIVHDRLGRGLGKLERTRDQQKAFDNIANKHGGTAKDWMVLSQIAKIGDMRVAYLKKSQRYEFLAYVQGGLLVDVNEAPITHPGWVLWTMDQYGNVYTYDAPDLDHVSGNINQVNHSSMNAGREVICAGMIQCTNGQVTTITNTSGHYKPTASHLAEAMDLLVQEGLDFTGTEVWTVSFANVPPNNPGKCWWILWNPQQFVASRGLQGEIRREIQRQP
jgi:hypothetical protein